MQQQPPLKAPGRDELHGAGPGGHFAAVDAPDLFLEDVRAFFRELH
jgi:hypothetical protein